MLRGQSGCLPPPPSMGLRVARRRGGVAAGEQIGVVSHPPSMGFPAARGGGAASPGQWGHMPHPPAIGLPPAGGEGGLLLGGRSRLVPHPLGHGAPSSHRARGGDCCMADGGGRLTDITEFMFTSCRMGINTIITPSGYQEEYHIGLYCVCYTGSNINLWATKY